MSGRRKYHVSIGRDCYHSTPVQPGTVDRGRTYSRLEVHAYLEPFIDAFRMEIVRAREFSDLLFVAVFAHAYNTSGIRLICFRCAVSEGVDSIDFWKQLIQNHYYFQILLQGQNI